MSATQDTDNERIHIGANRPPEDTPFEKIEKRISDLYDEAKMWLDGEPVHSKGVADSIANLANLILEAHKDADILRKEENKPFDEGKSAVQSRYGPLISDTKSEKGKTVLAREACKKALEPWLKAEAVRVAQEAAEAQRKAQEAADAARKAAQETDRTNLSEKEEMEEIFQEAKITERIAVKAAKQTAVASGGIGRGIGIKTEYTATLDDYKTAAVHYSKTQRQAFLAWLQTMADADLKRGTREIPGFTITEEKVVR